MIRLHLSVISLIACVAMAFARPSGPSQPASRQRDYSAIATKASRFFSFGEWANAAAMYELMLEERPKVEKTYVDAIVVAGMRELPDYQMSLVDRAQQHLIPLQRLFDGVRKTSFAIGHADLYRQLLEMVQQRQPWLARSIDRQLLDYYLTRQNADMIEHYARIMLKGAPDNADFLNALAYSYLLQGRMDEAMAGYARTLVYHPSDYTALLALGCYYHGIGQTAEARPYLESAWRIRQSPDIAAMLAPEKPQSSKRRR